MEPQAPAFEAWLKPRLPRRALLSALILALIAGGAAIVYESGGTQYGYPHLLYIPILLAAALFNVVGGVLAGMLAGAALWPIPMDVATGTPQNPETWLFRMGFFILVGLFSGTLFYWLSSQLEAIRSRTFFVESTGLPNRNLFDQVFEKQQQGGRLDGGLLLVEVQGLETVSRTLGYRYTESLLKVVAARLNDCLASGDFMAHLSPHQFLVVRNGGGAEELKTLAAAIRGATEDTTEVDGVPVYIETAVGIVRAKDFANDTSVTVVQKAEEAADNAQRLSSGIAFYQPEAASRVRNRVVLLGEFPHALRHDELVLHFQPQLCLKNRRVRGVEALVRWEHPKRGRVPPGEFIGAVEQTALIDKLTVWVLREGLQQLRQWQHHGHDFLLAINVSAHTLHNPRLVEVIREILEEYGVPPGTLEMEVTESGMMAQPDAAIEVLGMLAELGVTLAIDDFGTGHSSLAYLKDLPARVLKMDRSFLMDMLGNRNNREIMRKTIELAHSLDKVVVAEGVESEGVMHTLAELGCDYVQGYHVLPPVSAADLGGWLHGQASGGRRALV